MAPRTKTPHFIVTGLIAFIGGLATAFAVSSCDVVNCTEMDPDDPACVPEPIERIQDPPPVCDRATRPSVHVVPVKQAGDLYMPVGVDMVWFTHDGVTQEARCIHDDDGCSEAWVGGYDLVGPIKVSTEYCDTMVSQSVKVHPTEDGCHAQTEFILLEVSTLGCLTDRIPSDDPRPPSDWPLVSNDKTEG